MELANVNIASELTSPEPAKQINALLILIQQYSSGIDIQSYIQSVIQNVLIKTTNVSVKKLCYQLIKGGNITNKFDWDFVIKALIEDITQSSSASTSDNTGKDGEELCTWGLRTVVSLCGASSKLHQFFLKQKRVIEDCVFNKNSPKIRVEALKLVKTFVLSLRKSSISSQTNSNTRGHARELSTGVAFESSVDLFGKWIIQSIEDVNQEVCYTAFEVLRELICGDCVCHFHQEALPVAISRESMKWIVYMSKYYSVLMTRIKNIDANRRYPALRPITYISLYMQQNSSSESTEFSMENDAINIYFVMKPMLYSLEFATVLEAAHCILLTALDSRMTSELTACNNNFIDSAINAYLSLLDRNESLFSHSNIMKDICSVMNFLRDKYSVCARIVEHISKIEDDENRMYILTSIYSTIIKYSVKSRLNKIIQGVTSRYSEDETEIVKIFKEPFIQHVWISPSNEFEARLRCEILFCMAKAFCALEPADTMSTAHIQAWISVGTEICNQGKACLMWSEAESKEGLNLCISEFGKALTKICVHTLSPQATQPNLAKNVLKTLKNILDIVPKIQTEYAEILSMCILSNYIPVQFKASEKGGANIVFDHTKSMINRIIKQGGGEADTQKVDTLLYCMLCICLRLSFKLRDMEPFVRGLLENKRKRDSTYDTIYNAFKKVEYAVKYNVVGNNNVQASELQILFGKPFNDDHPVFKCYFTAKDDQIMISFIKGYQMLEDIKSRLHAEDPFSLKAQGAPTKIHQLPLNYMFSRSFSKIISQPSDPLAVTASYVLLPDLFTVRLQITVQNTTSIEIYQVIAEIGVEGTLTQFDNTIHATENIGDMQTQATYTFQRDFLAYEFNLSTFNINISCSHVKKTNDADILMSAERKDVGGVNIRCEPFELKLFHFLQRPASMSHPDFLTLWELYKTSFHKRVRLSSAKPFKPIETVGIVDYIMQQFQPQVQNNPFFKIPQKSPIIKSNTAQLCYASRTLFGDYILGVVFCHEHYESNTIVCDFEFRTSSAMTMSVLQKNKSKWFETEMINPLHSFSYIQTKNKSLYNCIKSTKVQLLREDSNEREKFDILSNVNDEHRLSVTEAFNLNEPQVAILLLQKWTKLQRFQAPILVSPAASTPAPVPAPAPTITPAQQQHPFFM